MTIELWKPDARDLPARIMGQEIEYGSIAQTTDGSWEGIHSGNSPATKERLRKVAVANGQNIADRAEVWLPNGAKVYFDVGHLEIASAECLTARDVVLASKASERVMTRAFRGSEGELDVLLLRDNSDSQDEVCFAVHENYLVLQSRLMATYAKEQKMSGEFHPWFYGVFLAFIATRVLLVGAGSVIFAGSPKKIGRYALSYRVRQISHVEDRMATGAMKPVILIRHEAHSQNQDHFRLQLAVSDPNVLEVAEYLKFGTTALVLRLLERQQSRVATPVPLDDPISVLRTINADPTLTHGYRLHGGGKMGALDIQEAILYEVARVFPDDDDPAFVVRETNDVLERWANVLDALRTDVESAAPYVDWVLKRQLINAMLDVDYGIDLHGLNAGFRSGQGNMDALYAAKALEQRYAETTPSGLGNRLMANGYADRMLTEEEVRMAESLPPGFDEEDRRTRSWPRGALIAYLGSQNNSYSMEQADWSFVTASDDRPPGMPKKVKLDDPFRWYYSDIERLQK